MKRDNCAGLEGQNNPYLGLIESLAGDVIVRYGRGRRILDLGARSPRISSWVACVSPYPIVTWPAPGSALPQSVQEMRIEQEDKSYDLIYSMWTFPRLGADESSSRAVARGFLQECARIVRPGGHLLIHARNAKSLRGAWARTGRRLISYVSNSQHPEYERWDSLPQFVRMLPSTLELVDGHGLGVLTLNAQLLKVPVFGRIGRRIAWRLRDSGVLRHLAGDVLCVVRRVPEPTTLPTQ